jgi:hypothetical protein
MNSHIEQQVHATKEQRPSMARLDHETTALRCQTNEFARWSGAPQRLAIQEVDLRCTRSSAHCSDAPQRPHRGNGLQQYQRCTEEPQECLWTIRGQVQRKRRCVRHGTNGPVSQSVQQELWPMGLSDYLAPPRHGVPQNESIHRPKWRRMLMRCRQ